MPETHILLMLQLLWQQCCYQEIDPCTFLCFGTCNMLKCTSSWNFLTRRNHNSEENFTCSERALTKSLYVLLSTRGFNTTYIKKVQCPEAGQTDLHSNILATFSNHG